MYAPRPHGGYVTIDTMENIVMHDTLEDALAYACPRWGCNVYEAEFTPHVDLRMVHPESA